MYKCKATGAPGMCEYCSIINEAAYQVSFLWYFYRYWGDSIIGTTTKEIVFIENSKIDAGAIVRKK